MDNKPYHSTDLSQYSFLITGGAGFIGSNLVEYLLKYNARHVRVLDNLSNGFKKNIEPYLEAGNFEFIEGDIRDLNTCKKAVEGMDYVSHQAALGSVPRSIADPVTSNEVNVSGFLNMLVAAKDSLTVKRLVYAASSSTYGDSPALPKKEHIIGKPLSPYAVTKYVNELYADVFYKTYGLENIGLRYFNVFGPRQSPTGQYAAVIPLFIEAVRTKSFPRINGNGEQTRDFTYIDNVVKANILALFADHTDSVNQVFNIACGEKTSLNELLDLIKDLLDVRDLKPIYSDQREGDIMNSLADITKAENILGYKPDVKIREGLTKMLKK